MLIAILADRFARASLHRLLTKRPLFIGFRLLGHVRVSARVISFEDCGRGFTAKIAIEALVMNVIPPGCVVCESVCEVSHGRYFMFAEGFNSCNSARSAPKGFELNRSWKRKAVQGCVRWVGLEARARIPDPAGFTRNPAGFGGCLLVDLKPPQMVAGMVAGTGQCFRNLPGSFRLAQRGADFS